jgi:hypothetical protein
MPMRMHQTILFFEDLLSRFSGICFNNVLIINKMLDLFIDRWLFWHPTILFFSVVLAENNGNEQYCGLYQNNTRAT